MADSFFGTENLEEFKEWIKTQQVAVLGMGVSNTPLILYLSDLGVEVTVFDKATEEALGKRLDAFKKKKVSFSLGNDYLKKLKGFDLVFKTPGIRPDVPELLEAEKEGARLTSEMEVFFEFCPAEIFAVTGSDGKTTTTTIIHRLLTEAGYKTWLGGNIGTPLLNRIDEITKTDKVVLELSSFQLQTMKRSPHVAVITNVSPNHLDYHTSMDEYVEAKKNIFRYQTAADLVILNADNELTSEMADEAPGEVLFFSRQKELEQGAFLSGDNLCWQDSGGLEALTDKATVLLPGDHNVENYLAAIAATRNYVTRETVHKTAGTLKSIEHRIEFVRELNGVKYYNDSIGSSPSRTIATLNAFNHKVVLIAGGYDKKIPYDPLGDVLAQKVRHLILIGETAGLIEMAITRRLRGKNQYNDIRITHCGTLEQAVNTAFFSAKPGEVVLLSPASASFDMFRNFEERGNAFKAFVNKL